MSDSAQSIIPFVVVVIAVTVVVISIFRFCFVYTVPIGKVVAFRRYSFKRSLEGPGNFFTFKYYREILRDVRGDPQIFSEKENKICVDITARRNCIEMAKKLEVYYEITDRKKFSDSAFYNTIDSQHHLDDTIKSLVFEEVDRWEKSEDSHESFCPEKILNEVSVPDCGLKITNCRVISAFSFVSLSKNGVAESDLQKKAKAFFKFK